MAIEQTEAEQIETLKTELRSSQRRYEEMRADRDELQDELDDAECSTVAEDIMNAGEKFISKIGRIRDIQAGLILDADLNLELDQIVEFAREKAVLFGVVA